MADTINLIIDTDAGIDDLLAIAFLAMQSNVNIQAITVVNGLAHVPDGAGNILQLLAVMGKPDVPVYMGEEEPTLGGTNFEEDWRVTADELPGIFDTMRIVTTPAKTGAVEVTIHGDTKAEWNIFEDPGAAAKVFASALPIFLVPLDACDDVPIDAAFLQAAAQGMTSETAFLVFKLLMLGFGSNGGGGCGELGGDFGYGADGYRGGDPASVCGRAEDRGGQQGDSGHWGRSGALSDDVCGGVLVRVRSGRLAAPGSV